MHFKHSQFLIGTILVVSVLAGKKGDPCDCMDISKDDFGSTKKVVSINGTPETRLRAYPPSSMGLKSDNDGNYAKFVFGTLGSEKFGIAAGAKIYIALYNGNVITLDNSYDATPVSSIYKTGYVVTTWDLSAQVDKTTLETMSKSSIKAIKLKLEGKEFIHKFSEKKGEIISLSAQCLLNDSNSL